MERREGRGNWEAGGGLGLAAAAAHVGDVCKWGHSQVLARDAAPHLEGLGAAPRHLPLRAAVCGSRTDSLRGCEALSFTP